MPAKPIVPAIEKPDVIMRAPRTNYPMSKVYGPTDNRLRGRGWGRGAELRSAV